MGEMSFRLRTLTRFVAPGVGIIFVFYLSKISSPVSTEQELQFSNRIGLFLYGRVVRSHLGYGHILSVFRV